MEQEKDIELQDQEQDVVNGENTEISDETKMTQNTVVKC